MLSAIISIKPRYAELILNGEKTVEFRKSTCIAQKLYIYAAAPQFFCYVGLNYDHN